MKENMFYGASPIIFEYAKQLRNNMTDAESILWGYIKGNQLGVRFKAQHPINNFIADFYCHTYKLVIEVDGTIHFINEVWIKDKIKEEELVKFGIIIIRFTNQEIHADVSKVLETIRSHLH